MKIEATVKTMPTSAIAEAQNNLRLVGENEIIARGTAYSARCETIRALIQKAKDTGVSCKQMLIDLDGLIKLVALAKGEAVQLAERDAEGNVVLVNGRVKNAGTEWKLSYSMGRAYIKCAEIAYITGARFTPTLYHEASKAKAEKAKAEKTEKIAKAEEALANAKTKADKAKAKIALENVLAEKTTTKTGGRQKKETAPTAPMTVTRYEVAAHGAKFLAMLRSIGEEKTALAVEKALKAVSLAK